MVPTLPNGDAELDGLFVQNSTLWRTGVGRMLLAAAEAKAREAGAMPRCGWSAPSEERWESFYTALRLPADRQMPPCSMAALAMRKPHLCRGSGKAFRTAGWSVSPASITESLA